MKNNCKKSKKIILYFKNYNGILVYKEQVIYSKFLHKINNIYESKAKEGYEIMSNLMIS